MKIKKEYLNTMIHYGSRRIYLGEVIDARLMEFLENKFPMYLEEEKPKKTTKKKDKNVASEE